MIRNWIGFTLSIHDLEKILSAKADIEAMQKTDIVITIDDDDREITHDEFMKWFHGLKKYEPVNL